ncbi:ABC transporter ATP-binding protein [Pseudoxanthomonas sp. PXM03]|uniref:ABC transporter ATP-binding protein n=1 Tax=Pseudoxanthomonas sp. PXM03 TaxID=2769284 RepID=UPI00177B54D3|nr:ABC transporter ATP-binding protein [Pseudoxanthomonas sp. PXM03]MBD9435068.1 ABC transporter ATP-binding protein [Pseudoxanthomonas sp. PXM03]
MSSELPPEAAITVRGLGKCYQMYEKPVHRLMQGLLRTRRYARDFWALRGLDMEIKRGETFGIIGRNGSGKSTLLQMIAGTLTPTEGEVVVNGKVAALLELGSGFNPDFTGRENVFLNAAILGLSREQVEERLQSILAFADIGEFIDQPVRSYSSGMAVRLAFSVIAHVDADILIVDEALSVGDAFFSQKCMRFLREFQKRGTLLFVSHDSAAVTNLCDRAIWLDGGRLQMEGASREVVESYLAQQHASSRHALQGEVVNIERKVATPMREQDVRHELMRELGLKTRFELFEFDPEATGMEFGAGDALIRNVELRDELGAPLHVLHGGELVSLRISTELIRSLDDLIVGFYLKDRLGQRLFGDNTHLTTMNAPVGGAPGEALDATFQFRMPTLPAGTYMFDVAVASGTQEDHTQHHWVHDALQIKTTDNTMRNGLVGIPMLRIDVSKAGA